MKGISGNYVANEILAALYAHALRELFMHVQTTQYTAHFA